MRKFILIAALVLASASAQAAGSRSLSLASNDEQAARRKPRRDWTEARIIGELHRHGIYW
jgi:hypothetical protein